MEQILTHLDAKTAESEARRRLRAWAPPQRGLFDERGLPNEMPPLGCGVRGAAAVAVGQRGAVIGNARRRTRRRDEFGRRNATQRRFASRSDCRAPKNAVYTDATLSLKTQCV
jgi:hypothetical protein